LIWQGGGRAAARVLSTILDFVLGDFDEPEPESLTRLIAQVLADPLCALGNAIANNQQQEAPSGSRYSQLICH